MALPIPKKKRRYYFDSGMTGMRGGQCFRRRFGCGEKHVYCEKKAIVDLGGKSSLKLAGGRAFSCGSPKQGLCRISCFSPRHAGKTGAGLVDSGFLRQDFFPCAASFGYWVFRRRNWQTGPAGPSWNYKKGNLDGGINRRHVLCHWALCAGSHVLGNGGMRFRASERPQHPRARRPRMASVYACTADDAAYGSFELDGNIFVQINSSWTTRVLSRRSCSICKWTGPKAAAIAGLRDLQDAASGEYPPAGPGIRTCPNPINFREGWTEVPDNDEFEKCLQGAVGRCFLRHVVVDEPFPHDFVDAARGVQLRGTWLEVVGPSARWIGRSEDRRSNRPQRIGENHGRDSTP